jgi:hypothetical protein
MARKASSKPDSGSPSTATLGFEADSCPFSIRHSELIISSAWVQHLIHHLAPQPALRDSAILQSEASQQVVSEAKDNMADFVLANGSMSSNQSGDCPERSASSKPKAKPQSLPRQRDIRRALIEDDLVDCMVALPEPAKLEQVNLNAIGFR